MAFLYVNRAEIDIGGHGLRRAVILGDQRLVAERQAFTRGGARSQ